jgi:hypothetical protein
MEDLLEEASRHLGREVSHVYSEHGELIKRPEQIAGNRMYILSGAEPFDYRQVFVQRVKNNAFFCVQDSRSC